MMVLEFFKFSLSEAADEGQAVEPAYSLKKIVEKCASFGIFIAFSEPQFH